MSRGVWETVQRLIFNVISKIYEEEMKKKIQLYKSKKDIILAGDGAWSNRRNSKKGVYSC